MSAADDYPGLYDAGGFEWTGEEARAALAEIDLLRNKVATFERNASLALVGKEAIEAYVYDGADL